MPTNVEERSVREAAGGRRPFPRNRASLALLLSLLTLLLGACGGGGENQPRERPLGGAGLREGSARVDNPLFPLLPGKVAVYEGRERDPDTGETIQIRAVYRVLQKTERVAGHPAAVLDVSEYEDGELVEHTLDYHTQDPDGTVWYLGEHVDDYEGGRIVGHEGQWLAGKRGASPGLFMPARPKVGDSFEQERAPGVAEDRSTVVAVGLKLATRAGRFSNCIKTRDYAPLDKRTEHKYYCPGAGLVREEGPGVRLDLVRRS